jgi:hypothetical protein
MPQHLGNANVIFEMAVDYRAVKCNISHVKNDFRVQIEKRYC